MGRFKKLFEHLFHWGEHLHFASWVRELLAEYLFDPLAWIRRLLSLAIAAVTGIWAKYSGLDWLYVWLITLASFAFVAIAANQVHKIIVRDRKPKALQPTPTNNPASLSFISLFEAATRAYEQLQDHDVSIAMEAFADSSDQILVQVADMLTRAQGRAEPLVKLQGTRPPSRIQSEIYMAPLDKYEFVVEGKSMALVGHNGSVRYENLMAEEQQVASAILEIKIRHDP